MSSTSLDEIRWKQVLQELDLAGAVRLTSSPKTIKKLRPTLEDIDLCFGNKATTKFMQRLAPFRLLFRLIASIVSGIKVYDLTAVFILRQPMYVFESNESLILSSSSVTGKPN